MTYIDPSDILRQAGGYRELWRFGSALRIAVRPINHPVLQFIGDHFGVEFTRDGYPGARFVTDFSAHSSVRYVSVEDFEGRFGKITDYRRPDPSRYDHATALDRLERYLGLGLDPVAEAPTFHGLLRNCECFTNYIIYGDAVSEQVPPIVRAVLHRMNVGQETF